MFYMIEVEVLVIGSGIAALKAIQTAKDCNRKALAVDFSYSDGGYTQIINSIYRVLKAPLFINIDDVIFFNNLGIEVSCFENNTTILKEGDYIAKTLGYTSIDIQKNWFLEWVNRRKLCFHSNLFEELKKALGFEQSKSIHIPSNIRKIDVEKKIAVLTSGELIKYRKLIYTWPLPSLPKLLYPKYIENLVNEAIKNLKLVNIPAYILTLTLPKENNEENIKMYIHSTKASRMHTAITLNTENTKLLYIITTYSKNYPLLPGINEKLLSEIRKFKIASLKKIIKEYGLNIAYALINKIDKQKIIETEQKLTNHDIQFFGRLGQWKEQTVKEILQNKDLNQTIC